MRVLVQRVTRCEVRVGGSRVSSIGPGILALVGVGKDDTAEDARRLAAKVSSLRVFEDDEGRMNIPVTGIGGGIMVVPQFTLLADTSRGNRPGFGNAAGPEQAEDLYEEFSTALRSMGVLVQNGQFGANMEVCLVNDGPVTILLES